MCHFVIFLNEHFRAVYRAFDFMLAGRYSIYLKSLNVIKEMVILQCAVIELYMHLRFFRA